MMTTNYFASDYHQNRNRHNRWEDLSSVVSHSTGRSTHRTRNGPYNITEKDFDDHKVLYYVPSSYGSDYDLSQLDEVQPRYYSPTRVRRRRYYRSVDIDDDDDSILSSRRDMYLSPRRPQVIQKIYYDRTPRSQIVDYIYKEDHRPRNEEVIEYIVPDRTPRKRYVEEIQSIRQPADVENLPPITRSPRPLPTPRSLQPLPLNESSSPRRSKLKQQTPRRSPVREIPRKIIPQNKNQSKRISLKDVLAANRARRGSRIPKPRREVDEEVVRDLPAHNKNFIKNDFLIHK